MKNHIGMKYTFLGTKSTEKVLKSDEKTLYADFFQNFTEVQAQSILTNIYIYIRLTKHPFFRVTGHLQRRELCDEEQSHRTDFCGRVLTRNRNKREKE